MSAATRALAIDPILFQLAPERRATDPERLGGARVVAPEALERLQDMDALGVGQRDLPRQRGGWAKLEPRRDGGRQVIGLDDVSARENGGALDGVLQLAHIA